MADAHATDAQADIAQDIAVSDVGVEIGTSDACDAAGEAVTSEDGAVTPTLTFAPATPVTELNTASGEDDPTLTGDMLEICFERSLDIWCATRTSITAPWSNPALITELNSPEEDGTPDLSSDGLTIFFSSRRVDPAGQGGIEIYVATRSSRSTPWSVPVLVPELNTAGEDVCAAPSGDLLTVVLDSDRGGTGARDLYIATRTNALQPWGTPTGLAGLNTAGEDTCAWIDAAGSLLLFSTDRPGGVGGADIWFATRNTAGDFLAPAPVVGINTTGNEGDPWLSPDHKTIYFYSDQSGGGDIYVAQAL